MKKHLFLIPICALGLGVVSCSDNIQTPDNNETSSIGQDYLSVRIVPAGNNGTRATDYGDGVYEDGTTTENKVTAVRFYFFNEGGTSANVINTGGTPENPTYQSYYDWTTPTQNAPTDPENGNVESIVNATIIIDANDNTPASVVAVLNPTAYLKTQIISNIASLQNVLEEYNIANLTKEGTFVMSNSVYMDENFEETMEAVEIGSHIYHTKELALADPVVIYVERVVAKLRMGIGESLTYAPDTDNLYDTGVEYNGDKIYAKFLGWNVTATPEESRLMKVIDSDWKNDLFGNDEPWSSATRHRSFWALNPDVNFNYGNFGLSLPAGEGLGTTIPADNLNNINPANGHSFAAQNIAYIQENAAASSSKDGYCEPDDNTKVIVAAQLVDKDGKPVTLAEWGFKYMTVEDLATQYANTATVYVVTGNTYRKIDPEEITFQTAGSVSPDLMNSSETGRYYVWPCVNKDALPVGATLALSNENGAPTCTVEEANKSLRSTGGHAKIWNSGYTYWYFSIRHLGGEGFPGYYGVVRNHVYDATITALAGLGTPVYDPEETIYPEKPEDDDTMVAAEIRILSWRIVTQDVNFNW